jgi:hypothetical protein
LTVTGAGNRILDMSFGGGPRANIRIEGMGATGNEVVGCTFGIPDDKGLSFSVTIGVVIDNGASSNTIGGNSESERNIFGNLNTGVTIQDVGTSGNAVVGNYFGVDETGASPQPIFQGGAVSIRSGASGNRVGGAEAGEGNLIAAVQSFAVGIVDCENNVIQGNLLGTNADGMLGEAGGEGLETIGGLILNGAVNTMILDNVISNSVGSAAITITGGSNNNTIQGNNIGTDRSGLVSIPNGFHGISLEQGSTENRIGGDVEGEGNIISSKLASGILLSGPEVSDNVIQGNWIGTNAAGEPELGNGDHGAIFTNEARENTLGPGNIIAGNGSIGNDTPGVFHTERTQRNTVTGNSIFDHDGPGIALEGDANGGLESPVVTSVSPIGGTASNSAVNVEIYHNDPNSVAEAEGQTLFDTVTVSGGVFSSALPMEFTGGTITAIALDDSGNSSAFSAATRVLDTFPTAICRDLTLELGESGFETVVPVDVDDGSFDEDGDDIEIMFENNLVSFEFDCGQIGVQMVPLLVRGSDGNVSTCTAMVTVIDSAGGDCDDFMPDPDPGPMVAEPISILFQVFIDAFDCSGEKGQSSGVADAAILFIALPGALCIRSKRFRRKDR